MRSAYLRFCFPPQRRSAERGRGERGLGLCGAQPLGREFAAGAVEYAAPADL